MESTAALQQVPRRRTLAAYMLGDYTGQVFGQLSSTLLPVLVVAQLGLEQGGYFLPAQTIFVALGVLSMSIMSALIVEAARDPARAHLHARSILRRIAVLLVPAALGVIVGAPLLLTLLGGEYRSNASTVLQLMVAALVPRVVVSFFVVRCRLANRTGVVAAVQSAQALIVIGSTFFLAPRVGLVGVGAAVLIADLVPAVLVAYPTMRWMRGR